MKKEEVFCILDYCFKREYVHTFFFAVGFCAGFFASARAEYTKRQSRAGQKGSTAEAGRLFKNDPQEHQKFYEDFCRAFAEHYAATTPAAKVQKGWLVILSYTVEDVIRVPWVFGPAHKHGQLEPVSVQEAIKGKQDPAVLGIKRADELIRILTTPVVPPWRKE